MRGGLSVCLEVPLQQVSRLTRRMCSGMEGTGIKQEGPATGSGTVDLVGQGLSSSTWEMVFN